MSVLHPWVNLGSPLAGSVYATQGWPEYRSRGIHRGMDMRAPVGTPVKAVGGGTVVRAATGSATAGNWIAIRHFGGLVSRYLHMSKLFVEPGQKVAYGEVIGLSGNTGSSAAPHLHFDLLVPSEKLPTYTKLFGKPASGFAREVLGIGVKVPVEPVIPVETYSPKVLVGAKREGLRLRGSGPSPLAITLILGAGGLAAWYYYR